MISRSVALAIPHKRLSKRDDVADCSIAKPYVNLVSRGVRPAIVPECRAGDKAYLKSRRIEDWSSPQCDNS
jgi:hypothetical protein